MKNIQMTYFECKMNFAKKNLFDCEKKNLTKQFKMCCMKEKNIVKCYNKIS